jgi:hypothetical protein
LTRYLFYVPSMPLKRIQWHATLECPPQSNIYTSQKIAIANSNASWAPILSIQREDHMTCALMVNRFGARWWRPGFFFGCRGSWNAQNSDIAVDCINEWISGCYQRQVDLLCSFTMLSSTLECMCKVCRPEGPTSELEWLEVEQILARPL